MIFMYGVRLFDWDNYRDRAILCVMYWAIGYFLLLGVLKYSGDGLYYWKVAGLGRGKTLEFKINSIGNILAWIVIVIRFTVVVIFAHALIMIVVKWFRLMNSR